MLKVLNRNVEGASSLTSWAPSPSSSAHAGARTHRAPAVGAREAAARGEVVAGAAGHGGGERRCREAAGACVAGRRWARAA